MDSRELMQELEIEYLEGGQHKNIRRGFLGFNCPHCDDTEYHLGWSLEAAFFSCWHCGYVRPIVTLRKLSNVPESKFKQVIQHFFAWLQTQRPPDYELRERKGKFNPPYGHDGRLLKPHIDFLRGRKLNPQFLFEEWDVRGIGALGGRFAWTLFIPIFHNGNPYSWTTRAASEEVRGPRYIAATAEDEIIPAKKLLYGLDFVKNAMVIVEGPLDAWRIGFGAVATLGIAVTPSQLNFMARVPNRIICFDSDDPGKQRAETLANWLEPLPGQTQIITLDTGKDPCEASEKEIRKIRRLFLD